MKPPRKRALPIPKDTQAVAAPPPWLSDWKPWHGPALLGVLTVLMFGDVLGSAQRVLSQEGTDLTSQFLPWRAFGFGELKQGRLALWNPHLFSGTPYLGGFQSAMLYPPNLVHLLLPVASAINLLIALHIFLTGLFTYFWVRHRQVHALAATLAGAIGMFGGAVFLRVYAGHLPNLYTMAWTPLLLLSIDQLFVRPRPTWVLVGMAAVAMQVLAGHPQYVFYTGVAAGTYWSLRAIRSPGRWRVFADLAVIYAGGAALSAAQLLTGLSATAESVRSKPIPFSFASMFSFPPENLITLLVPGFFGDMVNEPYWGRWYLWEVSLFIGATGIVLAVYGAVCGEKRLRLYSLASAAVLLVLALGVHTPLFELLYEYAPGFGRFRGPSKFGFFVVLFVAMLSAVGLDTLIRARQRQRGLEIGTLSAAAGLAVLGAALVSASSATPPAWWTNLMAAVGQTGESYADFGAAAMAAGLGAHAAWNAGLGAFVAAATLLTLAGLFYCLRFGRWPVYGVAFLAVVEVFAYARMSRPTFNVASAESAEVEQFVATHPGDYRVLNLVAPNSIMTTASSDLWGYDPGVPLRYAELMAFTQGTNPDDATQNVVFAKPNPLYRMLRLKYVFAPTPQGLDAIEIPAPMGRVALIYDYAVSSNRDAIFAAMARETFDPTRTAILESSPLLPALHPPPTAEDGRIQITDETTDGLTVQADLSRPALLLVTDSYSKDWRARALPGSAQSAYAVLPANYVLMAVPLSAGHQVFRLEYAPRAFLVGRWISLGSLLLFLGAVAYLTIHARKRPRA